MNQRSAGLQSVVFVALCVFASPAALSNDDNNRLQDASFEQRLPPEKGGWILFDESIFTADKARTGSQSIRHWGYSRRVPYTPYFIGTVSGSYQEFAAAPGSRWRLTGYGLLSAALKGAPAFGILQLSFFDARGNDLGTRETAGSTTLAKTSEKIGSGTPVNEWLPLDTGIATAPEGTATVQAFTLYVDYSGADTTQGVYFDDLHLCALGDPGNQSECK